MDTVSTALVSARSFLSIAIRRPAVQAGIALALVALAFIQWYISRLLDQAAARFRERHSSNRSSSSSSSSAAGGASSSSKSHHRHHHSSSSSSSRRKSSTSGDAGGGGGGGYDSTTSGGNDSSTGDVSSSSVRELKSPSSSSSSRRSGERDETRKSALKSNSSSSSATAGANTGDSSSRSRIFGSGHERLGHVVTVRVVKSSQGGDDDNNAASSSSSPSSPTPDAIAKAAQQLAQSMRPPVHVVLSDTGGVQGELRRPTHTVLWMDSAKALSVVAETVKKIEKRGRSLGVIQPAAAAGGAATTSSSPISPHASPSSLGSSSGSGGSIGTFHLTTETMETLAASPTFTVHIEKSIKYCFDAARVMFSSGNTTERMHFGVDVSASGETVVDMFAGIGYFTVPLAVSMNRPTRIIAIEKNPDSCAYLACNTLLNDCVDRVVVLNGDNRTTGGVFVGRCNRVMMGYIPSCKEFLKRAASFLVQKKMMDDAGASSSSGGAGASATPSQESKRRGSLTSTQQQQAQAAAVLSPTSSANKSVSFAPNSTPPREKYSGGSSNTSNATTTNDDNNGDSNSTSSKAVGEEDDDTNKTSSQQQQQQQQHVEISPIHHKVQQAEQQQQAPTTRPIGTIHYHFLSESGQKQQAAAVAMLHVLEELGPAIGSQCTITELRVVKSYAPKKFHCVADLLFS